MLATDWYWLVEGSCRTRLEADDSPDSKRVRTKNLFGKFQYLCRDPGPVITKRRDPEPDESNDYFNF